MENLLRETYHHRPECGKKNELNQYLSRFFANYFVDMPSNSSFFLIDKYPSTICKVYYVTLFSHQIIILMPNISYSFLMLFRPKTCGYHNLIFHLLMLPKFLKNWIGVFQNLKSTLGDYLSLT